MPDKFASEPLLAVDELLLEILYDTCDLRGDKKFCRLEMWWSCDCQTMKSYEVCQRSIGVMVFWIFKDSRVRAEG